MPLTSGQVQIAETGDTRAAARVVMTFIIVALVLWGLSTNEGDVEDAMRENSNMREQSPACGWGVNIGLNITPEKYLIDKTTTQSTSSTNSYTWQRFGSRADRASLANEMRF